MVPPYFKDQSVPIISFFYTLPIAPTIFNYKRALQYCNIDDPKAEPPHCSCHDSPFKYSSAGHVTVEIEHHRH